MAESPPSSGGFFYFPQTIGKDHLFRETMKALGLWPPSRPMSKGLDKRPLLEEFRLKGFFLIDTCEVPVDKTPARERKAAIELNAARLARNAKDLDPESIVIVKQTVFRPVRDALESIGLGARILNRRPLPFPSHGNQRRFRTQLKRLIEISKPRRDS